jgi:predicted phage terminase large subunit-like protein
VDATRHVGVGYGPHYKGLLLRRTFPELEKSLIADSKILYPRLGGRYNGSAKVWTFPDGETIWFGHLEHDGDELRYQGAEFQFVGFDELTHFSEKQYLYIGFSRMRSSKGIRLRLRAGTNPGGVGHEWVFKRFGAWLDPASPVVAGPGEVVYFRRDGDAEIVVDKSSPGAVGRCFVPASTADNPHILEEYTRNLDQLDQVTRAQLRDGNWLIRPGRGLLFKRQWFEIVERGPTEARRCRYWDLAATENGGAYSAGVLMAVTDDGVYIENVVRGQWSPGQVEATILQTAKIDGRPTMVGLPQDPGQAGVAQVASYQKKLSGFNVQFLRETGGKVDRARPVSAQAEPRGGSKFGRVKLVRGPWNLAYLQELEAFPDEHIKDQVDATSGAFAMLMLRQAPARGVGQSPLLPFC